MADYKGLCITFEGDSSSLSAALNTINTRAQVAQGNLMAINSALNFNPNNVGLLQQKMVNLSDAVRASSDRLNGLKSATSSLKSTYAEASAAADSTKQHYNEYKQKLSEVDAALGNNAAAIAKNKAALETECAPLADLEKKMSTLQTSMDKTSEARQKLAGKSDLTAKERQELASLNSEYAKQQSEMSALKRSYDEVSGVKSKSLTSLNKEKAALDGEREALEKQRAVYGDYVSAHDRAVKARETAYSNLRKNQADIEVEAQRLEELNAKLLNTAGGTQVASTALGQFATFVGAGSGALVTLGGKLEDVGMKLSFFSGILTGTLGRQVLQETQDFGNAMSQVGGYLDVSRSKLSSLSDLALRVGYETQFSATEAAEAMSDLAKGGMTDAEIKAGGLDAAMQLAAAGQLDLARAADITVQAMRAFNLSSDNSMEIADALAGAANASTAEVSDLSSAFSNCSAVCSNAGWSIQETAGAIGELTDHGLSGEQAGTALKVMLQRLQSPTDKAADVMEKYGIEVRDAEGHMKSATEIVDILRDKLGSLDDKSRDNALQTMFGTRSSNAALIFMRNGSTELKKYIDAASRAGAASDMAQAQMGRLGWALEYLRGEAETAEVNLGNALTPTLIDASNAAQDLLESFNALNPSTQSLIGKTVMFAAAAGPVMLIGGKALKLLGTVGKNMSTAITFTQAFAGTAGYGASMVNRLGAALEVASGGSIAAGKGIGVVKAALATLPTAMVTAAVVGLAAAFVYASAKAAVLDEKTKRTNDAVKNLGNASSKASRNIEASIGSVDKLVDETDAASAASRDAATNLDNMTDSWENFANTIKTNATTYQNQLRTLNDAQTVIDRYANKSGLSAGEQYKLVNAVDELNKACGTQYEVVDAANGVIKEQGNDAVVTAGQLDELIAKQRKQALVSMYLNDYAKAQENLTTCVENQTKAQNDYNDALKRQKDNQAAMLKLQEQGVETWDAEYQKYSSKVDEYRVDVETSKKALEEATKATEDAANATDKYEARLDSAEESISKTTDSLRDFIDINELIGNNGAADWTQEMRDKLAGGLEDMGVSLTTFQSLSAATMSDIAMNFDGSMTSLVRILAAHKDEFKDAGTQDAIAFAQGLSDEQLQALSNAGALSLGVVKELSKYSKDSGKAGKDVVDAYLEGLKSGAIKNNTAAAVVRKYLDGAFKNNGSENATQAGVKQSAAFNKGVISQAGGARDAGNALTSNLNDAIRNGDVVINEAGEIVGGSYADGVSNSAPLAENAGAGLVASAIKALNGTTAATDAGSQVGGGFSKAIYSKKSLAYSNAKDVGSSASDALSASSVIAGIKGIMVGSKYASGISSGSSGAAAAASGLAGAASGQLGSPWAWDSGFHLGQNFASGISASVSLARSAATSVANAVSSILHHTVPETGPLHNDDVWGVHLAENFATGMLKGRGMVSRASLELANAVVEPTMSWGNGLDNGYPSAYLGAGVTYNLSIDGASVNDDPVIREQFINLMYDLKRRERSYCGNR